MNQRPLDLALCLLGLASACGSSADAGSAGALASAAGTAADDFKGCPEGIPQFEPGLKAEGMQLTASLIAAMPTEPERYNNDWTVSVRKRDGSPAPDAKISRGQTFMPIHGHDGRVDPALESLSNPGEFQLSRLYFSMRGPWEVRLWLQASGVPEDYVVFHICVAK